MKKEYDELLKEYEELENKYLDLNNKLYKIQCSRSYLLSKKMSKFYRPIRKLRELLHNKGLKCKKLKKFIKISSKIAIIPCSFEFDEFVNQRPINFAKYLSKKGYNVIFVAWQWDENTIINKSYKYVYNNILQIPLYDFIDYEIDFSGIKEKIFCINFPHEIFLSKINELRMQGFNIYYDIMDEWEEFEKVGQANWFDKSVEEKIILQADFVSAVSQFLIKKYNYLRTDIMLSPNGFYKELTGYNNKNIALKKVINDEINIGYFGHLTDSWFDWDSIFKLAKRNQNYKFHIIGYGIPEKILNKLQKQENIVYYGKIPTAQLHNYVKGWNIGIIPFKTSALSQAVDPIKIYEYLYMGLPVIVSGIENVKNYPRTFYIESIQEFEKQVIKIVNNPKFEEIDDFLEKSTWESRFEKLEKHITEKGISELYEK